MNQEKSAISTWLANDITDAHDDWLEECAGVRVAAARLSTPCRADGATAFAAYMAALDREERAAESYEALVRRAGVLSQRPIPARLEAA